MVGVYLTVNILKFHVSNSQKGPESAKTSRDKQRQANQAAFAASSISSWLDLKEFEGSQ